MSSLTRRSTATDESSPIHTPYSDLPLPQYNKSNARFAQNGHGGVHIRSPSSATSSRSSFHHIQGRTPAEEPDSYFVEPPRHREHRSELSRRGTTKELIGRFEAMGDSSELAAQRNASIRRENSSIRGSTRIEVRKKDKGRSPIRQSLRNFLSVFKKNKPAPHGHAKESSPQPEPRLRSPSPLSSRYGGNYADTVKHKPDPPPLTLQIPQAPADPSRDERTVCISPVSAHTGKAGPLLYLSRIPTASNIPAVWMNCTAQLHSTHILIMWETPQGNPSPKLVSFKACADVRSLAPADLTEEERKFLPSEPEWKVFELLFEGRARERFAARSLTERATWVSAIWDAVLQAQEDRMRTPVSSESTYIPRSSRLEFPEPVSAASIEPPAAKLDHTDLIPPSQPSRISASSMNRDLPPVPAGPSKPPQLPKLDMRNLSMTASALSPLPAPPATPSSVRAAFLVSARPDSPSRTPSPSIRNLDQRSMVKQRLAQLENGSSSRPQSSKLMSPTSSKSGRDSPLAMRRQDTTASSRAESIVEAYMNPGASSPVSMRSAGLTTIASRMSSPTQPESQFSQTNEKFSILLHPPKQGLAPLSPASEYSTNDEPGSKFGTTTPSAFRPLMVPLPASPTTILPRSTVLQQANADSAVKPMLEAIQQGVGNLQESSADTRTNIDCIRTKVGEVLAELRRLPCQQERDSGARNSSVLLERLDGIRSEILQGIQGAVAGLRATEGETRTTPAELPGLTELHEKLDSLIRTSQQRVGENSEGEGEAVQTTKISDEQLAEVLSLLRNAEEQRAAQSEQQTDSIRYLNELNTWLEAFVKHGTSQIDGVAADVQQLCRELAPIPELQDDPDAAQEGQEGESPSGSLLSDIRRLLVQNREREQNTAELHASVNGLMAAVQEELRQTAEVRSVMSPESVIGMIDQQRQHQEGLLKALATELSADIRGERLRFVEAMKEATAINVQIHVEQFKKELTREVITMTQEVSRLERERQGLEQHIADLFAFYAKQKQGAKGNAPARSYTQGAPAPQPMVQPTLTVMPGAMPSSQSVYRRPLPSPAPTPSPTRRVR
ncbi:hypothetical protein C8Q74DRAFT_1350002 [Fomes fomentarius]|nr:hypothetical protein C8Q74DRAFT_1350002 [Fomes fomentarius]